jgi:hypothetical protein
VHEVRKSAAACRCNVECKNDGLRTNMSWYDAGFLAAGRILKTLSEAVILHEALHNVTGLCDIDLENFLGLDPAGPSHH